MITSKLTQEQINRSIELLNRIRSDEGELFPECVDVTEGKQKEYLENCVLRYFDDSDNCGIYISMVFFGSYRVFIAFENDTDKYVKELSELILLSKKQNPGSSPCVYFIGDQTKLIDSLNQTVKFDQDNYYASHEFIMDREHFKGFVNDKQLEIKPYEAVKIGDYAQLLDKAMTFVSPPTNFQGNTAGLAEKVDRVKENAFYTFYKDGELIGLYWLDNDFYTIYNLVVAPEYQRQGYGDIILSHAIDNVFTVQKHETAKLYCVDWNEKGLAFYKKYGMILKGHTYAVSLAE